MTCFVMLNFLLSLSVNLTNVVVIRETALGSTTSFCSLSTPTQLTVKMSAAFVDLVWCVSLCVDFKSEKAFVVRWLSILSHP